MPGPHVAARATGAAFEVPSAAAKANRLNIAHASIEPGRHRLSFPTMFLYRPRYLGRLLLLARLAAMSEFGRTPGLTATAATIAATPTPMFVPGGPSRGKRVHANWPGRAPERRFEARDPGAASPAGLLCGYIPAPRRFPGLLSS